VRAVGVVGEQDLSHEHEKVEKSTRSKRRFNGGRSLTFTQMVIENMRMGHSVMFGRPTWLKRLTTIGDTLSDARPDQRYSKFTKTHAFQYNVRRYKANSLILQIESNVVELVGKRQKIFRDLPRSSYSLPVTVRSQLLTQDLHFPLHP
jgi:hypothetical protein